MFTAVKSGHALNLLLRAIVASTSIPPHFGYPSGTLSHLFFPPNNRIYFCIRQVAVQTHATFLICHVTRAPCKVPLGPSKPS